MPSIVKNILACLLHVFYKVKIKCKCFKCCESDCIMQTDNISLSENKDETKKENNNITTL